jgi:hypothetical protein
VEGLDLVEDTDRPTLTPSEELLTPYDLCQSHECDHLDRLSDDNQVEGRISLINTGDGGELQSGVVQ